MMSVLQNSFANSSSSLIQSKITGNIVFVLLPPLTHWELFGAYVLASMLRGLAVGAGVFLCTFWLGSFKFVYPLWTLAFALLGSAILGTMGVIAGIWAEKFDQIAVFQNFIIMPLTFLAGVFYSTQSLPPFWQWVSHFNPFFTWSTDSAMEFSVCPMSPRSPVLQPLWRVSCWCHSSRSGCLLPAISSDCEVCCADPR